MIGFIYLIILLFSISLHESAHAFLAFRLGDPTPKIYNRISLNPLNHLDFYGSFLFPLITLFLTGGRGPILGWAKPVPINPYNFKNPKWDSAKAGLAGPLANILLALFSGLLIRFLPFGFFSYLLTLVFFTNLSLAFFNLLPIPPLDGSHLLFAFLKEEKTEIKAFLVQWGPILILFFIFFVGLGFIFDLTTFFYQLITGYSP